MTKELDLVFETELDLENTKVYVKCEVENKIYKRQVNWRIKDYDKALKNAMEQIINALLNKGFKIYNITFDEINMG